MQVNTYNNCIVTKWSGLERRELEIYEIYIKMRGSTVISDHWLLICIKDCQISPSFDDYNCCISDLLSILTSTILQALTYLKRIHFRINQHQQYHSNPDRKTTPRLQSKYILNQMSSRKRCTKKIYKTNLFSQLKVPLRKTWRILNQLDH